MKRYLLIVISIVFIFVPIAQAENLIDSHVCVSGDIIMLHADAKGMIMSFDSKGIMLSNNNSEILNNVSERCVGIFKQMGEELIVNGYCKYLYPNKDISMLEFQSVSGAGDWKFILGTGKWEGIAGGGTWGHTKRAESITPDSFQNCRFLKGTYELPE